MSGLRKATYGTDRWLGPVDYGKEFTMSAPSKGFIQRTLDSLQEWWRPTATVGDYIPDLELRDSNLLTIKYGDPESRRNPYKLRGRNHELLVLIEMLHAMPTSGNAVLGPPGSGKTAIGSYMHSYASAMGFDVLSFIPADFKTEQNIADIIDPDQPDCVSESDRVSAEVNAQIVGASTHHGTTIQRSSVKTISQAIVRLAQQSDGRGLLVMIDEMQKFDEKTNEACQHATELLECLHTNAPTDATGERYKSAVILFGHLQTDDLLVRMNLSRFSSRRCMRLQNLTVNDTIQVLLDHIHPIAETNKLEPNFATDIRPIAEATGGFPDFVAKAGAILQGQLADDWKQMPNTVGTIIEATVAELCERIEYERTNFYNQQLRGVPERAIAPILTITALIAAAPERMVPGDFGSEIISHHASRHGIPTGELMLDCIRSGLVELREGNNLWPQIHKEWTLPSHWTTAIHCFTTHAMSKLIQSIDNQELQSFVDRYRRQPDTESAYAKLDTVSMAGAVDPLLIPASIPKYPSDKKSVRSRRK